MLILAFLPTGWVKYNASATGPLCSGGRGPVLSSRNLARVITWSFWMLGLLVCAGHAKLLAISENYLHSLPIRQPVLRRIRAVYDVLFVGVPLAFFLTHAELGRGASGTDWWYRLSTPWQVWWLWGLLGICALLWASVRYHTRRPPPCLVERTACVVDVAARTGQALAGSGLSGWLARLPRNQQFTLEVNTKTFLVPRLPAEWDGLTIVHLSDLHLRGPVQRRYFEEVVYEAAALQGEMIAFTGDLLDTADCLAWVPDTLGRLSAPLGCYFVLGNHDWYLPVLDEIRQTLRRGGWIDLAGVVLELAPALRRRPFSAEGNGQCQRVTGPPLVLAGNERPWMGTLPDLSRAAPAGFRIVLSHSPDQLEWARQQQVDVLLAGHTHGGQICLPVLGPVYSPSRYSCRYASGEFWKPPTLLHVSRGISGREPIRYRCRPELSRLVLRCAATEQTTAETGRRSASPQTR